MPPRKAKRVKWWIEEWLQAKRQWLEILKSTPKAERRLSEEQQADFVRRYFIEMERALVDGLHKAGPNMAPEEVSERIVEVQETIAHYQGRTDVQGGVDLEALVEDACLDYQLYAAFPHCQKVRFGSALARANAESFHRHLCRLRGQTETSLYPEFQGVSSATILSRKSPSNADTSPASAHDLPLITLGELADLYIEEVKKTAEESSLRTYRTIVRVVKELLGNSPAEQFTHEAATAFLQSLLYLSPNIRKHFRGKSVQEVIEINKRAESFKRLKKKMLENYLTNFSAILNFGVSRECIRKNPLSDKFVRSVITQIPETPEEVEMYTIEELNTLFRAPLFTGCKNDKSGVNRPGPNRPRRGRFWLPLLALYHGFRLNEVAQL